MSVGRCRLACRWLLVGVAILAGPGAGLGQDSDARSGESAAVVEAPPPPRGGTEMLRQRGYMGLWPFYSREQFEDGTLRETSLLGLLRRDTSPSGAWHHHILPFYCVSSAPVATEEGSGTDWELGLYPLLYSGRRSPDGGHDAVVPFFFRWDDGKSSDVVLWPFIHATRDGSDKAFAAIWTLYRHGTWENGSRVRARLGVPFFLSLYERLSEPAEDAWTVGTFVNTGWETQSGLSLIDARRKAGGDESFYLFPLLWAERSGPGSHWMTPLGGGWRGAEGRRGVVVTPLDSWGTWDDDGHDVRVLFPLVRAHESPQGRDLHLVPFYAAGARYEPYSSYEWFSLLYGRTTNDASASSDHYLPLLLSHWGTDVAGWSLDVLWPLGHYAASEAEGGAYAIRALPFYDRKQNAEGDWMGVGTIFYRRHLTHADSTLVEWAPWPLSRWRSSPRGSLSWVLPFFYHRDDAWDGGLETATFVAPSFYTSDGELSWTSLEGSFSEQHYMLLVWPFFGAGEEIRTQTRVDGSPGIEWRKWTGSTLTPLFQIERSSASSSPDDVRTSVDAPWPLLRYSGGVDEQDFRLFPLVFLGTSESRDYLYALPLISLEKGRMAEDKFWPLITLFDAYAGPDEQRMHLFPFLFRWSHTESGSTSLGALFYLFYYQALPSEGWVHLLPLGFGRWTETGSSLGIFPFYFQRKHGPEPIDYWNPARVLFVWNTLSNDHEMQWSFLGKVVQRASNDSGDEDFRILHRFFINRTVKGQREVLLNPLFRYFRDDAEGVTTFHLLHFLYRWRSEGSSSTASVFFIPVWSSGG